jgi:protein-tyrosine phosphatase
VKSSPYWINAGPRRRLAIVARPRGGDWLDNEIAAWKTAGISIVVSLLTPDEEVEFNLQDEAVQCRDVGIEFVSVPVVDRAVPASGPAFFEIVQQLHQRLDAGAAIGVHCRAGIGRSSLLAAAILVSFGYSAQEALRHIQDARGLPVPETPEQRDWIENSANGVLVVSHE